MSQVIPLLILPEREESPKLQWLCSSLVVSSAKQMRDAVVLETASQYWYRESPEHQEMSERLQTLEEETKTTTYKLRGKLDRWKRGWRTKRWKWGSRQEERKKSSLLNPPSFPSLSFDDDDYSPPSRLFSRDLRGKNIEENFGGHSFIGVSASV